MRPSLKRLQKRLDDVFDIDSIAIYHDILNMRRAIRHKVDRVDDTDDILFMNYLAKSKVTVSNLTELVQDYCNNNVNLLGMARTVEVSFNEFGDKCWE